MTLKSHHIAAFTTHHCHRYLHLHAKPATLTTLLPPDVVLPAPHLTPAPEALPQALTRALRGAHAKIAERPLPSFLSSPHRRPAYAHRLRLEGADKGKEHNETIWLLRKARADSQANTQHLLLIAWDTTGKILEKRFVLGLQAHLLLAQARHEQGPGTNFQVDGYVIDASGSASLERQCSEVIQGRSNFDIVPYTEAVKARWQEAYESLDHNNGPLHKVPLAWGSWCEDCPFHRHCLADLSARQDAALLPGLSLPAQQAMREIGLTSIQNTASCALPLDIETLTRKMPHAPAPRASQTRAQQHTLAQELPHAIQRARRLARRYALAHQLKAPRARNTLAHTRQCRIPDTTRYHGLRQMYVDIGVAPSNGRAYLLAALKIDGRGRSFSCEFTQAPPTKDSERAAFLAWLTGLNVWLLEGGKAPHYLHFYTTNASAASHLLSLCKRHEEAIWRTLPQVTSWLSQPRLLQQELLSLVCDEAREQLNIPTPSTSLSALAEHVGYVWPAALRDTFGASLFAAKPTRGEPGWLFGAAPRHRDEIPYEFAQKLWSPGDTKVSVRAWRSLARARLDAMEAIVRAIPHNPTTPDTKQPLKWPNALAAEHEHPETMRLLAQTRMVRAHELSGYLDHWARPLQRRIDEGSALPLRFDQTLQEGWKGQHLFALLTAGQQALEEETRKAHSRLTIGDTVLIAELADAVHPWSLRKSWLGRIQALAPHEDGATLRVEGLTWVAKGQKDTGYAWRHKRLRFSPEKTYILCPAADAPRRHRLEKVALQLATHPLCQGANPTNRRTPERPTGAEESPLEHAPWQRTFTPQQHRCVDGHLYTRGLCVYGPPGTGKTSVLIAHLITQLCHAIAADRPLRVFLCTKQRHCLLKLVERFQSRWEETTAAMGTSATSLRVALFSSSNPHANGRERVPVCHPDRVNRKLYAHPQLLLAGTPSSAYKLHRKRPDFFFDIVAIDEAQELEVLEGLMATQSLHSTGQWRSAANPSIRCTRPKHPWEQPLHQLKDWPPTFFHDWLVQQPDCQTEQLHQGFRLPASIVGFFDRHVHWHDFPRPYPGSAGFTQAATEPTQPPFSAPGPACDELSRAVFLNPSEVVLLLHDEMSADQWNPLEANIITKLLSPWYPTKEVQERNGKAARSGNVLQLYPQAQDPTIQKPGVGVIVGSRNQKAALHAQLLHAGASSLRVGIADEFQGQTGLDYVIASATCASSWSLRRELPLLLHPDRLRLAWSRHRRKLIVLVSKQLFALTPRTRADMALLAPWYALRARAQRRLGSWLVDGYTLEGWCDGRDGRDGDGLLGAGPLLDGQI